MAGCLDMMYSFKSKDVEASVVLAMAEDRSANLGATKASAPARMAVAKKMRVENLMVVRWFLGLVYDPFLL
jgi:hypothetical protein